MLAPLSYRPYWDKGEAMHSADHLVNPTSTMNDSILMRVPCACLSTEHPLFTSPDRGVQVQMTRKLQTARDKSARATSFKCLYNWRWLWAEEQKSELNARSFRG